MFTGVVRHDKLGATARATVTDVLTGAGPHLASGNGAKGRLGESGSRVAMAGDTCLVTVVSRGCCLACRLASSLSVSG